MVITDTMFAAPFQAQSQLKQNIFYIVSQESLQVLVWCLVGWDLFKQFWCLLYTTKKLNLPIAFWNSIYMYLKKRQVKSLYD